MSQLPRSLNPDASPLAYFGARLRALRNDRGMSQVRLGRAAHISGDLIAKLEKAERRPLPEVITKLDTVLHAGGELIRLGAELPRDAAASPTSAGRFSRHDLTIERPPEPEVLTGIREILAGCRRLDHMLGPKAVLATVSTQVEVAEALLPASRGRQREELLSILAELYQLAGWLAFDHGDAVIAGRAFESATRYAVAAENSALLAFILGPAQGFAATYNGRPADGVAFGTQALAWARQAGIPRLTAFVLATTARGYARLGDTVACFASLDASQEELSRADGEEPVPDWLTVFDAAALEGHRGSCLLDLAHPDRAVGALGAQDATAPRCFARNRAIWLLDRTRANLELRDLEAACHTLMQALPLTRATSSRRIGARIRQSAAALAPHRSLPVVGGVLDEMRALRLL